ncbi:MAG: hypothetical protein J6K88_03485 [Oscillospiraceae bacterium]|nr:hypothetical protein [Oscillospiraceae bacterium]
MKVLAKLLSINREQLALIAKLLILIALSFAFKPIANEIGYGAAIILAALISPALLVIGNKG